VVAFVLLDAAPILSSTTIEPSRKQRIEDMGINHLPECSGVTLGAARPPTHRLCDCTPIAHFGRKT
jgi:hypothetical protein